MNLGTFSFLCLLCLGRSIEKVDIRPFINNLPFGRDTSKFCTQDGSGSTTQAANIVEALEIGSKCLLIDEVIILIVNRDLTIRQRRRRRVTFLLPVTYCA